MSVECTKVFLPCHSLDDFPTWLDEGQAEEVLAAWTAAWHPCLLAATGGPPSWASVDLPPPQGRLLGIVPPSWDERFATQTVSERAFDAVWIRGLSDPEAITEAAARDIGAADPAADTLPGACHAADFQALGLAVLLAELVARRMRSTADLEATGFAEAVVTAARAAVAGRSEEVRSALNTCFGCLESTRARYYPVDVWAIDIVLLSASTCGAPLLAELDATVPFAVIATGGCLEAAAHRHPDSVRALRKAIADGTVGPCGGRDDDSPVDACTPEQLLASFERGRAAWKDVLDCAPTTFARLGGGASPLLPQVLTGSGCSGALWSVFDGSPLPDPGTSRIRWEGCGGGVEAIARPPLDARLARTVLELPDALGDAMDHDHTAIVQYARHAGTGSRWHGLIRRIGGWSGLLGRFTTPHELLERTAGMGTLVSFEPDAYPPTPLPPRAAAVDPVTLAVAAASREAERIVAATAPVVARLRAAAEPAGSMERPPAVATGRRSWWSRRLFAGGEDRDEFVLDNGLVRLQVNRQTGGVLSLRRPGDRGNRLSQQLALRTTRPPADDGTVESPANRAAYTSMRADRVERGSMPCGSPGIISHGSLLDAGGVEQGNFTQRAWLVPGAALALLELDVRLSRPLSGVGAEQHVACRFAWHENENVELRRSLHTQSVVTDRERFTAPHFIEVCSTPSRNGSAGQADAVTILTGGMPWHVRSSPHMLDTLLFVSGASATRRLGLGLGLERPWDAALTLAAGMAHEALRTAGAATVRITVHDAVIEEGRLRAARVGLLESAGRRGEVRLEWADELASATACDPAGTSRSDAGVTIEGRSLVAHLDRYDWLHLDLVFKA